MMANDHVRFYLQNFDLHRGRPINEHDLGLRCRGNIQMHRYPDGKCLCFVSFNVDWEKHVHFWTEAGQPLRLVYNTCWRVKRLLDQYA